MILIELWINKRLKRCHSLPHEENTSSYSLLKLSKLFLSALLALFIKLSTVLNGMCYFTSSHMVKYSQATMALNVLGSF